MRKFSFLLCLLLMSIFIAACGKEKNDESVFQDDAEDLSVTIGELEATTGTDVVLVMDESGSMINSDKSRLAIAGAQLFVDMEKLTTANLSLVEFSSQTKSSGMIDVTQVANKEHLKNVLDKIRYSGETDTGAALLKAIDDLNSSGPNLNKSIVLFTDGVTDCARIPGRETEESLRDVDTAIRLAKDSGYKIYCIGLNDNHSVDEDALANIALSTGGQYKITSDVLELTEFFQSIFGAKDDVTVEELDSYIADGQYRVVPFNIDDKNIIEANIVVLSNKKIEDIEIVDPAGNTINLRDGSKAYFSSNERYTLAKILFPQVGEWVARVKAKPNEQITISKICNYDMTLVAEVSATKVVAGQDVQIEAYLSSSGKIVNDEGYYESLKGFINVNDVNNNNKNQIEMSCNENGSRLIGTFTPDTATTYEVRVHLDGNGFYRDTDSFYIESFKYPAEVSKESISIQVVEGKEKSLDLAHYFKDPEGAPLTFSTQNVDKEVVETQIEDSELVITGVSSGENTFAVYADNGSVEKAKLLVEVKCQSKLQSAMKLVIPVGAILVLALLALFIVAMSKSISGKLMCKIETNTMNVNGTTSTETFDIINKIDAASLGKRGFSAKSLLNTLASYYNSIEFDADKKQRFNEAVNFALTDASKVKFNGTKQEFTLEVVSGSKNVLFIENNIESSAKKKKISLSNSQLGAMPVIEKSFGIKFTKEDNPNYTKIIIKYSKM